MQSQALFMSPSIETTVAHSRPATDKDGDKTGTIEDGLPRLLFVVTNDSHCKGKPVRTHTDGTTQCQTATLKT